MAVYLHGFTRDEHTVDYVFTPSTANRSWDPRTLSDQDRDLAEDIECLDMVHRDFDDAMNKVRKLSKFVDFCFYRNRNESCTLSFTDIISLDVCTKGEKSQLEVEFVRTDGSHGISLGVPLKATGVSNLLGAETEEERARIVDLLARFLYVFSSVDVRELSPDATALFRAAKERSNEWKRFKNLHNIYREGEEEQDDDE
jgi:hypothetical protein